MKFLAEEEVEIDESLRRFPRSLFSIGLEVEVDFEAEVGTDFNREDLREGLTREVLRSEDPGVSFEEESGVETCLVGLGSDLLALLPSLEEIEEEELGVVAAVEVVEVDLEALLTLTLSILCDEGPGDGFPTCSSAHNSLSISSRVFFVDEAEDEP